ncbi:MAG TPA: lipid A export permease/ATP-binding protein MsbA [Chromatiales bacterium]|nr:lipid A export permease/ATP-binding protein MsbA [Chromatiales bacterium]
MSRAPGVYRRLLRYAAPYAAAFAAALAGMAGDAAASGAFAALMKPLLDGTFVARDPDTMRWAALALVAVALGRALATLVYQYGMSYVGRGVIRDLRRELFAHLLRLPAAFFDRGSSGQLVARFTYHTEQVAQATTDAVVVLVRDSLTVLALLGVMLWHGPLLTLAVLLVGPPLVAVVAVVSRRFRRISRRIQATIGDVAHIAEEAVRGHRVIKVFGGEPQERAAFEAVNERNRRQHLKHTVTAVAGVQLTQLMTVGAISGLLLFAASGRLLEGVSPGTFVSFLAALGLMLTPLRRLIAVNATLQRGIAAGESVFELLDLPPERDTGGRRLARARGEVAYRGVRFAYEPGARPVLDGIDLEARPGEVVALVGRSGAGKSTLVSLLPRFYDPTAGAVLLDGVDVREYRLRDLREQIALVEQDVVLFNTTIAENIAYGRADRADRAAIEAAARAAQAWDFIERLPDGLDTVVGERGLRLSGGQRQRIAIARALLKDAPILILDEATSALDSESERAVQRALERLMEGRTTFVIAHRLSTVEHADRIVVLREGRVAEVGTHGELLARGGEYAALYRTQLHATDAG